MLFDWRQIPEASAARYQTSTGSRVHARRGHHWREVRRFFFRPVLVFRPSHPDHTCGPVIARLGGYQHAVPPQARANSQLNCLFFRDTANYSAAALPPKVRREVRLAEPEFQVRRLADPAAFCRHAHPVYLSFLERSQYEVGCERRDPAAFARWANILFSIPEMVVLGGYRGDDLQGVCVAFLAGDTVNYVTAFCHSDSLRQFLPSLLLHTVRAEAAQIPGVTQVFVGMQKAATGVDRFYLLRGAQIVALPAWLELNPLARLLLQRHRPALYARILGTSPAGPSSEGTE